MDKCIEKRKSTRVKTHIPIRYRKLSDTEGRGVSGTISNNLGEGGVRFRSKGFISRACRLIMELDLPMLGKPVKVISKVAWIHKAPSGDDYEVGGQFLEISRKDKELVSEYVNGFILYNEDAPGEEPS